MSFESVVEVTAAGGGAEPAVLENVPFDELFIGQTAERVKRLTWADVQAFAAVSGDTNPAHLDPAYAAQTQFHDIVAHGMWTGALISAVLGTQLPGLGTIYLGQNLRFSRPVHIDDTVTVRVMVRELQAEKRRVVLDCLVVNQRGETVVSGDALVMAPAHKVRRPPVALPWLKLQPAEQDPA